LQGLKPIISSIYSELKKRPRELRPFFVLLVSIFLHNG
jgi:hypothetical protein